MTAANPAFKKSSIEMLSMISFWRSTFSDLAGASNGDLVGISIVAGADLDAFLIESWTSLGEGAVWAWFCAGVKVGSSDSWLGGSTGGFFLEAKAQKSSQQSPCWKTCILPNLSLIVFNLVGTSAFWRPKIIAAS